MDGEQQDFASQLKSLLDENKLTAKQQQAVRAMLIRLDEESSDVLLADENEERDAVNEFILGTHPQQSEILSVLFTLLSTKHKEINSLLELCAYDISEMERVRESMFRKTGKLNTISSKDIRDESVRDYTVLFAEHIPGRQALLEGIMAMRRGREGTRIGNKA